MMTDLFPNSAKGKKKTTPKPHPKTKPSKQKNKTNNQSNKKITEPEKFFSVSPLGYKHCRKPAASCPGRLCWWPGAIKH